MGILECTCPSIDTPDYQNCPIYQKMRYDFCMQVYGSVDDYFIAMLRSLDPDKYHE